MAIIFENNVLLFVLGYVVAIFLWIISKKIGNQKVRKALRVSVIFLFLPLFYLWHPFLFYQVWMMIVISIVEFDILPLACLMAVWGIFLILSQITGRQKKENGEKA